jgi:hypothetical protein
MAKAKIGAAGIEYIQGAMKRPKKVNGHNHGNYLVATHRTAETTNPNCQRIYSFDADRYNRSTPVTTEEQEKRTKFAAISRMVQARKNNLTTLSTDQEAYAAQKNEPGGKKTWKAYLWKVCKEAYEENSH